EQRNCERVFAMTILIENSSVAEGDEHLAHMTSAEWLLEQLLRFLHDLKCREFAVTAFKVRDHVQQFSLPIGRARPSPGKEIRIEFSGNIGDRDNERLAGSMFLQRRIVKLAANELDEIRIA